jgi:hypothetical protein
MLFVDDLPIAMTINEEIRTAIKDEIKNVEIKGIKYTFPEEE